MYQVAEVAADQSRRPPTMSDIYGMISYQKLSPGITRSSP